VVHKKYTFRNGKLYGPYLYENTRVGEKVITTYVGKDKSFDKKFFVYALIFVAFIVLALFLFNTLKISPTGRAILNVGSSYTYGMPLSGTLKFILKTGELIPADSIVRISLGGRTVEISLYNLLNTSTINGTFFAENTSIVGVGDGYGVAGDVITYPNISFQLLISNSNNSAPNSVQNQTIETNTSEVVNQTEINQTVTNPTINESSTNQTSQLNNSASEKNSVQNQTSTSDKGSAETSNSDESAPLPTDSTPSDVSASTDSGITTNTDALITGSTISENSFIVKGIVNANNPFSYNLDSGQTANIVPDSVLLENGSSMPDNIISLSENAQQLVVQTSYSESQQGFGSEFIGSKTISFPIDISSFGINVTDSSLRVELVYGNESIASAYANLTVINNTLSNQTDMNLTSITQIALIPTIRIAPNSSVSLDMNDYFRGAENYNINISFIDYLLNDSTFILTPPNNFSGASIAVITAINGSESLVSNPFEVLVSSGAFSIITSRSKIVVDQPVQWTKNVTLISQENITIDLPASAQNISVTKFNGNGRPELARANIFGLHSNNLNHSGNYSVESKDISLQYSGSLTSLDVTNSVINSAFDTNSDSSLDIAIEDNSTNYLVNYYTSAATLVQSDINAGTLVNVSGPSQLNYTDVIAHTNLSFRLSMKEKSHLRVYWFDYGPSETNYSQLKNVDEVNATTIVDSFVSDVNTSIDELESQSINQSNSISITGDVVGEADAIHETSTNNSNSSISQSASETGATSPQPTFGSNSVFVYPAKYNLREMPFDAYDINGDGLVDYTEWVVPHLSNQTFIITLYNHSTDCAAPSMCMNLVNSFGRTVGVFDSNGNLDLRGQLKINETLPPGNNDFAFSSQQNGTKSVAWLEDVSGDLHIKGNVYTSTNIICSPKTDAYEMTDSSKRCVSIIDSAGNLWIKGNYSEEAYIP
jgi:hypothetical protein